MSENPVAARPSAGAHRPEPRRKRRIPTWLIVVVLLLGAALGVTLIWRAFTVDATFEAAPMPKSTFSVADPTPRENKGLEGSKFVVFDPREMKPNTIYVPNIALYAPVVPEGWTSNEMDLPRDLSQVGWSNTSVPVGAAAGVSLYSGHVNYDGVQGALWNLTSAQPGDMGYVADGAGMIYPFIVTGMASYSKIPVSTLPSSIFVTTGPRIMVILTCAGGVVPFNGGMHYQFNAAVSFAPNGSPFPRNP